MSYHIADLFCGAGGTSAGAVEAIAAMGRTPRLTAINHWDVAVATHTANHPTARHLCTGVDSVNPRDLYREGELDLLWASPECTHHSIARGGKPINDQSRATAWCVVRWAEALRPPVILIENVPEFQSWGPIGSRGQPLASRKGETFRAWLAALESLGYKTDYRLLCAADYGDPTTRTRLFVQAVRGRRKIVWPHPTHSRDGDLLSTRRWRSAREVIDWSLPSQSIWKRKKPLAENTRKRIAAGLRTFGGAAFLATVSHGGGDNRRVKSLDGPMGTVTAKNNKALVQPFIVPIDNASSGARAESVDNPLSTVIASNPRHGLCEPFLVEMRNNKTFSSVDLPLSTVTAGGRHHGLVEAFLVEYYGNGRAQPIDDPLPTVTTRERFALVEPFLIPQHGGGSPRRVSDPVPTVATKGAISLIEPIIIEIDGRPHLLDIRFRMLQPSELAAAQGFASDYQFTGNKTEITRQVGNAVPRRLARALVAATVSQSEDVSALVEAEEGKEAAA